MPSRYSRREFVKRTAAGVSAAAALSALPGDLLAAAKSPFHVGVINDEIGQDFGRVLEIITKDFGLEWVELRGMWSKNILKLDDKEIAEAQKLRWAKLKATNRKRRTLSPAARARIVAAQKARWAKFRAQKKK